MTSCARTVWNQSRLPSDTQQAAAEEVQRSCSRLHTVFRWKVFTIDDWTTIQLAERRGLCANRNQEATHWSQLQQSATHALNIQQIVYGVKNGYDWTDICQPLGWRFLSDRYWDWKNLCVNKILFNVVYSQNNMLLMAKFAIFCVLWFPKVRWQGKELKVTLDRWGGKWNHLSTTHKLTTDYAKNYCNRTLIVQVILENVVTCFLVGHSVEWMMKQFGSERISKTKYRRFDAIPTSDGPMKGTSTSMSLCVFFSECGRLVLRTNLIISQAQLVELAYEGVYRLSASQVQRQAEWQWYRWAYRRFERRLVKSMPDEVDVGDVALDRDAKRQSILVDNTATHVEQLTWDTWHTTQTYTHTNKHRLELQQSTGLCLS